LVYRAASAIVGALQDKAKQVKNKGSDAGIGGIHAGSIRESCGQRAGNVRGT